jgi:hypothetical protein
MKLFALAIIAAVFVSCGDTNVYPNNPTAPAPTPLPTLPPAPQRNVVQFRVNGNAIAARIRYSDPVDGLTQVVTSLPYLAQLATTQTEIFLSLDVTPTSYPLFIAAPFLSAQIVVNGSLFREATADDTTLNTLSVNGTWRAN